MSDEKLIQEIAELGEEPFNDRLEQGLPPEIIGKVLEKRVAGFRYSYSDIMTPRSKLFDCVSALEEEVHGRLSILVIGINFADHEYEFRLSATVDGPSYKLVLGPQGRNGGVTFVRGDSGGEAWEEGGLQELWPHLFRLADQRIQHKPCPCCKKPVPITGRELITSCYPCGQLIELVDGEFGPVATKGIETARRVDTGREIVYRVVGIQDHLLITIENGQ